MVHTLGIICSLLGILLSIIGIVTGFWLAITQGRGEEWFNFVPAGFVFLLLGVTVTQLHKK